jgi:HlyD family secretion protein
MALSRKRKLIIIVSSVILLALIVVISIFAKRKDVPEVVTVKIENRSELRSTVTAPGEIRPIQFINLTSEVAGRIEELYVNPGDHVKRGQPVVRLDPTQLQTNQEAQLAASQAALSDVQNARSQVTSAENSVAQAQQALASAEAAVAMARQQVIVSQTNVDRAQVDLNRAQRELKRTAGLIESGIISRSEYDAAKDTFEQAQVSLRTAQEQLQQQKIAIEEALARANQQRIAVKDAQNGVARARASLNTSESRAEQQQAMLRGQTNLRSKATQQSLLDGIVVAVPAKVGQFAVANLSSTPLMTIADMSVIQVNVNVDETEIAEVEVNQIAKIKVDALGDREIEGYVKQKTPLAVGKSDMQSGGISNRVNVQEAKEFEVVIELRNITDEIRNVLRPGMNATATIITKVKNDVLTVPLEAIVERAPNPTPTPANGSGSTNTEKPKNIKGVYILDNNRAKFVEVTTGITGESEIEITSGLQSGMTIIKGPSRVLRTLKDNDQVKIQTKKTNSNTNEAK